MQGRQRRRAGGLQHLAGEPEGSPAALQWLEAEVQTGERSHQSSGLLLHLPGGMRLELTHPQQIGLAAALVQALAAHSSTTGFRPAPQPC